LFRDWRNKVSILFSLVCFAVSVWALGFVAHATLFGRLSYDIHLFGNVVLVPFSLELISRIFFKSKDRVSSVLFMIAWLGSAVLGLMILFSLVQGGMARRLVLFWPTLIFVEFLRLIYLEYFKPGKLKVDSISPSKKGLLYLGLGLTLSFCTFDHIPAYGFTLPALGNLLFTLFLFFTGQVIVPEKLPGLEALASRFLATLTVSLVITGFFALLYSYISATFPLFLLNSFLISFAVLALWGPLLTFFRYLTRTLFSQSREDPSKILENFKLQTSSLTDQGALFDLARTFAKGALGVAKIEFEVLPAHLVQDASSVFPVSQKPLAFLYRGYLEQERDQVLTQDRKRELDHQLDFLKALDCDLISILPVDPERVLRVRIREVPSRRLGAFPRFNQILELISLLQTQVQRVAQIDRAREKDRLVLLGEMAAGLAHEIRNPLGSIRGAVNLIEPDPGPWGKVIREEVDRLNRLVSQFLDFARDHHESREQVVLHELITRVVQRLKAGIPPNIDIQIRRESDSDSRNEVRLVPDSLQQVISNLVQNSVKALEGRPNPFISIHVRGSRFEVEDNGVGMDPETLARVFQPFFTSFKDGSGLGLSICEKLIRAEGGRISIRSVPGQGTTVFVEYPDAR